MFENERTCDKQITDVLIPPSTGNRILVSKWPNEDSLSATEHVFSCFNARTVFHRKYFFTNPIFEKKDKSLCDNPREKGIFQDVDVFENAFFLLIFTNLLEKESLVVHFWS